MSLEALQDTNSNESNENKLDYRGMKIKPEEFDAITNFTEHVREDIERNLDDIDYSTLQNLFSEDLEKSGVEGGREIVKRENVELDDDDEGTGRLAAYSMHDNKIFLYSNNITPSLVRSLVESGQEVTEETLGQELKERLLSHVCHEQSHAASFSDSCDPEVEYKYSIKYQDTEVFQQSGYRFLGFKKGEPIRLHELFNEGVTDRYASNVYKKYLDRTGDSQMYGQEGGATYAFGYLYPVMFVEAFCNKIAEDTGVEQKVVWDAVKRAYLNGGDDGFDINKTWMEDMFSEVFSEDVLKQLAETSPDNIKTTMDLMHKIDLPEGKRGDIREMFEKFQNS